MTMLIYERWNIYVYLILFIFSIMIDVKLTPVVCGGSPTYLYEWVDGVQD